MLLQQGQRAGHTLPSKPLLKRMCIIIIVYITNSYLPCNHMFSYSLVYHTIIVWLSGAASVRPPSLALECKSKVVRVGHRMGSGGALSITHLFSCSVCEWLGLGRQWSESKTVKFMLKLNPHQTERLLDVYIYMYMHANSTSLRAGE